MRNIFALTYLISLFLFVVGSVVGCVLYILGYIPPNFILVGFMIIAIVLLTCVLVGKFIPLEDW